MTIPDKNLRSLFRCSGCGHERKLPWKSDTLSLCPSCSRFGQHCLVATQVNPMDVAERMKSFAERMAGSSRGVEAKPVTAESLAYQLKSAGYSTRAIEGISKMRGQGLKLSDLVAGSEKRDAQWILFGGNGTGKTTTAARVAALRIQSGRKAGRYIVVPELRDMLGSAMTKKQDQAEIVGPLKTCALLVVDEAQDFGGTTDWVPGVLRSVADARYREFRPTIWLMNAKDETEVHERLGGRIVDRANETGGVVHCDWPSYRA